MKTIRILFAAAIISVLPFGLTSCGGDSHEAAMNDMVSLMGEVADIVSTAKDKDSATAAAKKIDAITPRLEAIAKRFEALGEPSPEEAMTLAQGMISQMAPLAMKMQSAAMAIQSNPEIAEALKPAFDRFQKATGSVGGAFGK